MSSSFAMANEEQIMQTIDDSKQAAGIVKHGEAAKMKLLADDKLHREKQAVQVVALMLYM